MISHKIARLLELPGIVVHELSHLLFCMMMGVKVHRIRLFSFGNPAGYVEHDSAGGFLEAFLISAGPFIAGSVLAYYLFIHGLTSHLGFLYLGFVISMNAFPSSGDAKSLFKQANRMLRRNPLVIFAYPFVLVVWLVSASERLKLNVSYAVILLLASYLHA